MNNQLKNILNMPRGSKKSLTNDTENKKKAHGRKIVEEEVFEVADANLTMIMEEDTLKKGKKGKSSASKRGKSVSPKKDTSINKKKRKSEGEAAAMDNRESAFDKINKTAITFEEDGNVVEMETEGMATEFMSNENSDEDCEEEEISFKERKQESQNNNAV